MHCAAELEAVEGEGLRFGAGVSDGDGGGAFGGLLLGDGEDGIVCGCVVGGRGG